MLILTEPGLQRAFCLRRWPASNGQLQQSAGKHGGDRVPLARGQGISGGMSSSELGVKG